MQKNTVLFNILFISCFSLGNFNLIAQNIDLTYIEERISNVPDETTITWHHSIPPNNNNRLTAITENSCDTTYYAAFYNDLNGTYDEKIIPVLFLCNTCPEMEVDLTALSVENTPENIPEVTMVWQRASNLYDPFNIDDPTAVRSPAVYYASFYNPIYDCYSTDPAMVYVTIFACCCGTN